MTKNTISRRNRDVADYLARTTISDPQPPDAQELPANKSPIDSARLAQELASDSSWADRYVPAPPSETTMGQNPSSAIHTPQQTDSTVSESDYATPAEAPPTYEVATSQPRSVGSGAAILTPTSSEISEAPIQPVGHRTSQTYRPPYVPGKHYSRHEKSSSINGTFSLHDSLDLSTESGSINIRLDVKPGSHPAILKLKSKSGSIRVDDERFNGASNRSHCRPAERRGPSGPGPLSFLFGFRSRSADNVEPAPIPTSDDPRKQPGQALQQQMSNSESDSDKADVRTIHATIETASGSVTAMLLLTAQSQTSINTQSGSIHLRMVTAGPDSNKYLSKLEREDSRNTDTSDSKDLSSTLDCQTSSGSQNVWLTTGWSDTSSGALASACHATFHCLGSGSQHIHFPEDWQGLVHGLCASSGHATVRGNGLELDQRGNSEFYAWRGVDPEEVDRAVELKIDGSGSASFRC